MFSQVDLQTLLNHAFDFIAITDRAGNYTFLSERYTKILGTDLTDFLGQQIFDRIHPGDISQFMVSFSSIPHLGQVQFAPVRVKDNVENWKYLRVTATDLSANKDIDGIVFVSQDISELVLAKQQLQRLEERDSALMMATGEAIFDWNIFKDTLEWTSSFSQHFGYRQTKCSSLDFYNKILLSDKRRVWDEIEDGMKSVHVKTIFSEFRLCKFDGSLANVDYYIIFLRDESGRVYRAVGSLRDISAYEGHLQNVRRKNAIISQIALSESHAARAPLSRMLNVIDLIIRNPNAETEIKEMLQLVCQLANEFDRNIKNLTI